MNSTKYLRNCPPDEVQGDDLEFAEIGQDIMESEELTNKIYETYLAMITKGWQSVDHITTKRDLNCSDIGIVYKIGPYIPCVKRMAYTRSIDLSIDGIPGIRVTANTLPGDPYVDLIRPFNPPHHINFFARTIKKYKYICFFQGDGDVMESLVLYFGINKSGEIISPVNKRCRAREPWIRHGLQQLYPALSMNAWSDSRYLWHATTTEDIGYGTKMPLRFRLGLSKEHIKSLFYARTLPITETGRKRPILHWVRAHQRRIKEGIDIDVTAYLRGIYKFEMDGLNFEITQPNKEALHGAEPETVAEAFRLYA